MPGSQPSGRDPPVRRLRKARRLRRKRRRKVEGRLNLAPWHEIQTWHPNMVVWKMMFLLCNGTCCRLHLSFRRCVTWYFYFCPGDRLPAIMSFHGSWPVIVVQFRTWQLRWRISLSLSLCIYYIWIYICIDIYMYREWKRMKKDMLQSTNLGGSISGWFGGYIHVQQGITTAQNDLISYSNSLRWTDPKNLPQKPDPSFWGSRRRRSSSSSSSSSSSHKKRRRKSKASKDDKAREKSRSKRRRRWSVVPRRCRLWKLCTLAAEAPNKTGHVAKHITCIPLIQEPWSTGKTMKS